MHMLSKKQRIKNVLNSEFQVPYQILRYLTKINFFPVFILRFLFLENNNIRAKSIAL